MISMSQPCSPERSSRQRALENEIRRLERRLEQLHALNRRYSTVRFAVFLAGAVLTGVAAVQWGRQPAMVTGGVAFLVFAGVVALHRRLDRGIARFTLWLSHKRSQLARLNLNWAGIRAPAFLPGPGEMGRGSLELDLDLTGPRSLHHLIDLAVSREGSQRLAGWLTQIQPDPAQIAARQAIVRELAHMPRFRDRLLLNFRLVTQEPLQGERFLKWLKVAFSARRLRWLVPAAALLTSTNLLLFSANSLGWLPAYWPISLSIYAVFYFYSAEYLGQFLSAVVELDDELSKFKPILHHLETASYRSRPNLARLCAPFRDPQRPPSRQLRQIKLVTGAVGLRMNPVLSLLINLVLPWDFVFAALAARLRAETARVLPLWLETWYQLEGLVSLANLAYLNPEYTFPVISAGGEPVFQATDMGHPLIPSQQRVCNDFTIPALGGVTIITGSNMSGKSTFIKTIGTNQCLAYAGGPVCAASLQTFPFRLHTCIRITDSISDGFSYFYAEVKCLRELLSGLQLDHPQPLLYLIDEIFRGTNNRERLIGSRAYIEALIGARGTGLIATHDLELAHLADKSPQVRNAHFRDQVQEQRLVFDYKIQPGPSTTTNAIKIMRLEGLPVTDNE